MRLRNIIVFITFLLVTQAVASAQGTEPTAPWPPDPDVIFEDGVQWEVVAKTETPQPKVKIDSENRMIQLIDATGGVISEYDLPPDIDRVVEATRVPGEQIQIEALTDAQDWLSRSFFLLDTQTGQYSPLPTVCDGQRVRTNIGSPQWTFVALDDQNNSGFLCDTETDMRSELLPDDFGDWRYFASSPDRQWLFLWGRSLKQENCCDHFFFTYHTVTNQISRLGTIPSNWEDSFGVFGWINSTQGFLCRYTFHQYIPRACYSFDLHQPDSLEFLFSGWMETMFQVDEPIRYGAFYAEIYFTMITGGGSSRHAPCGLTLYDNNRREQKVFGYECVPLMIDDYTHAPYLQRDDVLYFLTTDKRLDREMPEAKVSVLKSYNVRDLKGNYFLYKGEIESLLSVSPDHRYAVLLLDDNSVLDFPFHPYKISGSRGWNVGVLDMKSRQMVYQSEPVGVYGASQVIWLDDRTVVIASTSYSETIPATHPDQPKTYPDGSTLLRIEIDPETDTTDVHITNEFAYRQRSAIDINTSPNNCYLLLDDHRIVNLYTFEQTPLLRDDVPEAYKISTLWQEDHQIHVSVSSRTEDKGYISYNITLPDCAQGAEPAAPWPPDPDAIFEEGVQWEAAPIETPQPHIRIDFERRMIQLIDTTGDLISEYDFPPDVDRVVQATRVAGEQIQIEALTDAQDWLSRSFFLLDTETGQYSPLPTVCDGQRVRTNIGSPQWTFVALDDQNNSGFLCDTETDTRSELLPENIGAWHLSIIPENTDWLLLQAHERLCCEAVFYSYHIATGQMHRLGIVEVSGDDAFTLLSTADSTIAVICKYDTVRPQYGYRCYGIDLTQPDSLVYVFGGVSENIFRLDNPLRFGALHSDIYFAMIVGGTAARHDPCTLRLYDQDGVQEKALGYECMPLRIDHQRHTPFIQRDSTLYYLTTDRELQSFSKQTPKASILKSYDIRELKGSDFLYKGELESLLSVSPDGRYIVLLLDDNGVLDFPFGSLEPHYEDDFIAYRGWRVGILDTRSGELVYQSEPLGVYAIGQVIWLNEHTVIIVNTGTSETYYLSTQTTRTPEPALYPVTGTLLRIQLDSSGSSPEIQTTTEFAYRQPGTYTINASPNGCYLLIDDHRLVNLHTFEQVPLLRDGVVEAYEISTLWQEDHQVYVSVSSRTEDKGYISYNATLPDCTAPQK